MSLWGRRPTEFVTLLGLRADGAGNCVFCFMKGTCDLRAVAENSDPDRVADAPSDIGWRDRIERRYRRTAPARNGSGHTAFGFFGVNGPSYADIADRECALNGRQTTGSPAISDQRSTVVGSRSDLNRSMSG